MFDCDRDHAETVAQRPIPAPPAEAPRPPAPRIWQGQWLSPIAGGGTLVLGLQMFWAAEVPPPPNLPVSVAAFGGMVAEVQRPAAPRVALQVMEPAQAERFARGLARFDMPGLVAYAVTTERDMALRNQPLRAELADALALIRAEIARRGGRAGG